MNNTLITSIEESCDSCIRTSNLFAIKVFLENGLIGSVTLNNMMQRCIDTYANVQIIKLLMDHGATIPSDIQQVIKLPDELFMEAIYNIQFKTDFKLIELCVKSKNLSKIKWDILCSEFDFDQLNDQQMYMLMINASEAQNYFAFRYMADFIKHNERLLFLLLLEVASEEIQCHKCCDHLIGLVKLSQNQLVLCDICGIEYLKRTQTNHNNINQIRNKIKSHQQIIKLVPIIYKQCNNFYGTDSEFKMVDEWLEIINDVINESANDLS
jgi:hypothetical protein